jgi:hypothetical protein
MGHERGLSLDEGCEEVSGAVLREKKYYIFPPQFEAEEDRSSRVSM